jgi:DNA end-binding protein Ku
MGIKGNSGLRSNFSATVTLGLVSFPVKFITAAKENGVSFNQLHGKCNSRINQKVYCPTCKETVERDSLVRGFAVEKDKYVVVTDDDLARIDPPTDKAVEEVEFAPVSSLDSLHYTGTTYYLAVDAKQPVEAYRVVAAAMAASKVAAIVRYTRNKKRYAVIESRNGLLVLFELYYESEVRSAAEVPQPDDAKPDKAHVELAKDLIAGMTVKTPTLEHKDEYADDVRAVIAEKTPVAGKPTLSVVKPPAMPPADNLMVLMKKTMEQAAKRSGKKAA